MLATFIHSRDINNKSSNILHRRLCTQGFLPAENGGNKVGLDPMSLNNLFCVVEAK